jgi:hypothetical protein
VQDEKRRVPITEVDFDGVTRRLTSVVSELAFLTYSCQVHIPMLDFLDELVAGEFLRHEYNSTQDIITAQRLFSAKTAYLRSYLAGLESRSTYLTRRAQAQTQSVSRTAALVASRSTLTIDANRSTASLRRKTISSTCALLTSPFV